MQLTFANYFQWCLCRGARLRLLCWIHGHRCQIVSFTFFFWWFSFFFCGMMSESPAIHFYLSGEGGWVKLNDIGLFLGCRLRLAWIVCVQVTHLLVASNSRYTCSTYIYIYVFIWWYSHLIMYVHITLYMYVSFKKYLSIKIHMYVWIYIYVQIQLHVYIYIYIYVYVYKYK